MLTARQILLVMIVLFAGLSVPLYLAAAVHNLWKEFFVTEAYLIIIAAGVYPLLIPSDSSEHAAQSGEKKAK